MKKVLIISPYFPPCNTADMQRVRMSLPYFKENGWTAEVVSVSAIHMIMAKEAGLMDSIPKEIKVHHVAALPLKWTSKFGLGSLALRSLLYYARDVDKLLRQHDFDLVYFSTTQFPVCVLGAYWKKKYGIPYIIDMQDPWHNEYYQDKPRDQRPPKHWFSYRLNKWLEPIAMKHCDGLISVSQRYIGDLVARYPILKNKPSSVITFGAAVTDLKIASENKVNASDFLPDEGNRKLLYIGRGGHDMAQSLGLLFRMFKKGLDEEPVLFKQFRFHFLGTSYAPSGKGVPTVMPIALKNGVAAYVTELSDRVPYFTSLSLLQQADGLFVPGSNDTGYSASKIYNYMLAGRPMFCLFHPASNIHEIIKDCRAGYATQFDQNEDNLYRVFRAYLQDCLNTSWKSILDMRQFKKYSAEFMTEKQVRLFDQVLENTAQIS